MKIRNIFVKKGKILIFLAIVLLLIKLYINNNWILPWNGVKTEAKRLSLAQNFQYIPKQEINWRHVLLGKPHRGSPTKTVYYEIIEYSYTVNGTEYRGTNNYKISELSGVEDNGIIQITYDHTNPSRSKIGELEYFFDIKNEADIIVIIVAIVLSGIGFIRIVLDTPLKCDSNGIYEYDKLKNGKNKILKVEKIEIIDYERERVIFIDNEQKLYIYETDLGEEFKENEIYTIKLNRANQNRIKIEYNSNTTKAIKIVGTEKNQFQHNNEQKI